MLLAQLTLVVDDSEARHGRHVQLLLAVCLAAQLGHITICAFGFFVQRSFHWRLAAMASLTDERKHATMEGFGVLLLLLFHGHHAAENSSGILGRLFFLCMLAAVFVGSKGLACVSLEY